MGRDKLHKVYSEEYQEEIKYWSVRRIIADYKLYAQRAIKNKRQKAQDRILKKKRITELKKKPFIGFLLELDGITIYFSNEKRYILTAVDHHSRFTYARMYESKSSKNATNFLQRLMILHQDNIKNIHIDNGSEFKKDFQKAAKELNIDLYHARPYQPKDKPLIERFNGILKQEFIDLGNFILDPEEFNKGLTEWLIFYNFVRPHHSLGLQRPADYINMNIQKTNKKMSAKVLPMYSPITKL